MPRYALEILEKDGSTSRGDYESSDDLCLREGDYVFHDGRVLEVQEIRKSDGPFVKELVCGLPSTLSF